MNTCYQQGQHKKRCKAELISRLAWLITGRAVFCHGLTAGFLCPPRFKMFDAVHNRAISVELRLILLRRDGLRHRMPRQRHSRLTAAKPAAKMIVGWLSKQRNEGQDARWRTIIGNRAPSKGTQA
jgi:hypothetical protein